MKVYRSFDMIGVDERFGVEITPTAKGWRIETFSAYTDEKEYIYYVSYDDVPADVDWDKVIDQFGMRMWGYVLNQIWYGAIRPYRTVKKEK